MACRDVPVGRPWNAEVSLAGSLVPPLSSKGSRPDGNRWDARLTYPEYFCYIRFWRGKHRMVEAIQRGGSPLVLDRVTVEAADRAARVWEAGQSGPIVLGSEAHKEAFCRMLIDTHNPYRPSVVDWPRLEPEARDRLVKLPIWDIAMQTEGNASLRVLSYADTIADPLLREAVEIDGFEETRHKQVLSNLVQAYGIQLAPEPDYLPPRHPEWAFLLAGYCECVDTFFAFGLFALAKQSGFFPAVLVDTFEPVVQEEGRHILFFVNWVAWRRRNLPALRRIIFEAKVLSAWAFLVWERIGIARGIDGAQTGTEGQDNNFVFTGGKAIGNGNVSASALIDVCLSENERRFSGYDPRLLRPKIMPTLMRFARRLMRSREPSTPIDPA